MPALRTTLTGALMVSRESSANPAPKGPVAEWPSPHLRPPTPRDISRRLPVVPARILLSAACGPLEKATPHKGYSEAIPPWNLDGSQGVQGMYGNEDTRLRDRKGHATVTDRVHVPADDDHWHTECRGYGAAGIQGTAVDAHRMPRTGRHNAVPKCSKERGATARASSRAQVELTRQRHQWAFLLFFVFYEQ
ncbi:hypothetical protein MRX96_050059 [Rhipicephalus microplus]